MSHTALIRFAPLTTLERVNDPAWKRPGRTMYDFGALTFLPDKGSCPLLIDHDDSREIGVVRSLTRWDDTDGPWLAAIAEITDLPCWLRKSDTKASFRYKPAGTSHDVFGCEIARRGLITEVSVLSPSVQPAEPGAKVLTLHPTEPASSPAAVLTTSELAAGEDFDDYRPPYFDELERKLGYPVTWDNFQQANTEASRTPLEKLYDEHIAAKRAASGPQVLIRPGIGQVLAVGGVPVG